MQMPEMLDNVSRTVKDDLTASINKGDKLSIAAAGFSMYAYQALKGHLYDYVIYDSTNERDFATALEAHSQEVEVYVKLPRGFYISTPVGKYNPDWAIAFYEGKVKHIYFVAETKGDMSSMELRKPRKPKSIAPESISALSAPKMWFMTWWTAMINCGN